MVIAIDVDLTVVDTMEPWLADFEKNVGERPKNEDGEYDLMPEMNAIMARKGITGYNPFDFWKKSDLYDELEPLPDSVRVINELNRNFDDVIFVSTCVPEHIRTKERFLRRHFGPIGLKLIDTAHKEYVDYRVIVDDKLQHLNIGIKHRPKSKHIMFAGVRQDGIKKKHNFDIVYNWNTAALLIDNLYSN